MANPGSELEKQLEAECETIFAGKLKVFKNVIGHSQFLVREGVLQQKTSTSIITSTPVAVKEFPFNSLREADKEEIKLLRSLKNENLVQFLDAAESTWAHTLYFVVEMVPGGTLDRFCNLGCQLAFCTKLEIISKICGALGYLHQNDIVHHDIKPTNIMVGCKLSTMAKNKDADLSSLPGWKPHRLGPMGQLAEIIEKMLNAKPELRPVTKNLHKFVLGLYSQSSKIEAQITLENQTTLQVYRTTLGKSQFYVREGIFIDPASTEVLVAVKVFPFEELRECDRNEVNLLRGLNHENIVKFIDAVESPIYQALYFVIEIVKEGTLKRFCTRKCPLEFSVKLLIIGKICIALTYLHGKKIVHQDLKPENILLSDDGKKVKLCDFGLAHQRKTARTLVHSGRRIGTDLYMPPNLISVGQPRQENDIWSLGMVIAFFISGQHPFQKDNGDFIGDLQVCSKLTEMSREVTLDVSVFPGWKPESLGDLKPLILETLALNYRLRPPADEILKKIEDLNADSVAKSIRKLPPIQEESDRETPAGRPNMGGEDTGHRTISGRFSDEQNDQNGDFETGSKVLETLAEILLDPEPAAGRPQISDSELAQRNRPILDIVQGGAQRLLRRVGPRQQRTKSQSQEDLTSPAAQAEISDSRSPIRFNEDFMYRNFSEPKGLALIIVNKKFLTTELNDRMGSDNDAEQMKFVLDSLGYKTKVKWNLSQKGLIETMQRFSQKPEHVECDSTVVVILSHGLEGEIYGTDGKRAQVDLLVSRLNAQNCPNLAGKPKLFFIGACRGEKRDQGVKQDNSTSAGTGTPGAIAPSPTIEISRRPPTSQHPKESLRAASNVPITLPIEADIFIAYATTPGYVSWRNSITGTWFIQAICQVFRDHADYEDLLSMMTMVNRKVAMEFQSTQGQYKQVPEPRSRLLKKFFFFPGIKTPPGLGPRSGSGAPRSKSSKPMEQGASMPDNVNMPAKRPTCPMAFF